MSYDKYRGLLGEDGYIDYDGILHLIEENDRMKQAIDDAHAVMRKYANDQIDNVVDAYEEVCMALD